MGDGVGGGVAGADEVGERGARRSTAVLRRSYKFSYNPETT